MAQSSTTKSFRNVQLSKISKNIQDIKEQTDIFVREKKTTAVFFHTLHAVMHESPASAICLRLDVLFC